jgi:Transglycosylase SLT domain
VRILAALKLLAAVAFVCATAVVLTRRTEQQSLVDRRPIGSRAKRLFTPSIVLAVALLVSLAGFTVLAPFGRNDAPADGSLEPAALALSASTQSQSSVQAGAADSYVPLPPGANAYWHARAKEVGEKYFLGDLFVRQMMQESGFQDDVIFGQRVSWAGAEGIAQIMREHHPWVDPLKPQKALDYAARHMLNLLLRFDGDAVKALAAYNAGAGTVEWAVQFGGNDWFAWVPWETQEYTTAIMFPGEQGLLPNWGQVRVWWSRAAERIERPLQLRLLQGRTIAVGALPDPAPPADAAVAEAVPPVSP